VPSGKTTGKGCKLKYIKFHLNTRGKKLALKVIKPWKRLPREVMESLSLEIFKSHMDTFLSNLI